MKKRFLRAGISLTLAAGLLWGCGLNGLPSGEEEQSVSSSAEGEKKQQTAGETIPERESFPEEQEKPKSVSTPEPEELPEQDETMEERISRYLEKMTLEEKAAQLFIVLPESLTETGCVTAAGETTRAAFQDLPVGGFTYMEQNLETENQVKEMLQGIQRISMERIGLPAFTCVDEEGGTVARISGRSLFDVPEIGDMSQVGSTGDPGLAYETGTAIGSYLADLGFNVDFAPDADVLSNPENQVVRWRSFGSDPGLVSEMAASLLRGLNQQGVLGCYKHFPGHGATAGDTHEGYAYTDKSLEELYGCDLIPFQKGIEEKVPMIMAGHISLPSVTGSTVPASLSYTLLTEILREQMGYQGIVVTDAMNMGAIANTYTSGEAAVLAILAGADMILMPADLQGAYAGILAAVAEGTISRERIDESLERILRVKFSLMDQAASSQ